MNSSTPTGATQVTVGHVNAAEFQQEVLNAQQPVLVDFWAPWCGPCRMLAPILEAVAQHASGKVKVVKVNTDDNPVLANAYNVSGIPTLILFDHGQIADRMVGLVPKQQLLDRLSRYLR